MNSKKNNLTLRRLAALFLSCIALACFSAAGSAKLNLSTIVPSEIWYGIYFENEKVGYALNRLREIRENDKNHLVAEFKVVFQIATTPETVTTVETEGIYTFDMAADGILVKVNQLENVVQGRLTESKDLVDELSTSKVKRLLQKNDDKQYVIEVVKNDIANYYMLPYVPITVENFLLDVGVVQGQFDEGYQTDFVAIEVDMDSLKIIRMRARIIEKRKIHIHGQIIEYYVLELADSDGIMLTKTLDRDGRTLEFELFDGLTGRIESKDTAPNLSASIPSFRFSKVSIDASLPPIENISTVRLRLTGDGVAEAVPDSPHQTVVKREEGSWIVEISRTPLNKRAEKKDDRDHFVKSTPQYPKVDFAVQQVNPLVATTHLSDVDKIKRLVKFVDEYIEDEVVDYTTSVLEIIENRKGDCTEHTQLFITLARANGIPARQVSGYIYTADEAKPAFGAHAWAEVLLNGEWKQVDATWGEFEINPTHVEVLFDKIKTFKGLDIEVIAID
jgi:hypothetical protein